MKRHKIIGDELCAGEVMICRKCKSNFEPTVNPKNNKAYLWCTDCRAVPYNRRGENRNNLVNLKSPRQYQKMLMTILLTLMLVMLMMSVMFAQLITLIRSLVN